MLTGTALAPAGMYGRAAPVALATTALSAILMLFWTVVLHGPAFVFHTTPFTYCIADFGGPAVSLLLLVVTVLCAISLRAQRASQTAPVMPAGPQV